MMTLRIGVVRRRVPCPPVCHWIFHRRRCRRRGPASPSPPPRPPPLPPENGPHRDDADGGRRARTRRKWFIATGGGGGEIDSSAHIASLIPIVFLLIQPYSTGYDELALGSPATAV